MLKIGKKTLLFGVLLGAVFSSVVARADNFVPPDQIKVRTPVYKPGDTAHELPLGTYEYSSSWAGIPAASLVIDVDRTGNRYQVETKVKTARGIDLLYKLRYEANGTFDAYSMQPVKSTFRYQENSRLKETWMSFHPDGKIHSVRKKDDGKVEEFYFDPENFTLDPFSAAFLARTLKWKKGQTRTFDTFNGKTRYLIKFTAKGKRTIEIDDKEYKVWVISPTVKKLSVKKEEPQKLRSAEIYLTADKRRDIVGIKSEVFIGSVRTELVSYKPKRADRMVLAANR
jgi:hypothetical protein